MARVAGGGLQPMRVQNGEQERPHNNSSNTNPEALKEPKEHVSKVVWHLESNGICNQMVIRFTESVQWYASEAIKLKDPLEEVCKALKMIQQDTT